jgi:hypothetical protein
MFQEVRPSWTFRGVAQHTQQLDDVIPSKCYCPRKPTLRHRPKDVGMIFLPIEGQTSMSQIVQQSLERFSLNP